MLPSLLQACAARAGLLRPEALKRPCELVGVLLEPSGMPLLDVLVSYCAYAALVDC